MTTGHSPVALLNKYFARSCVRRLFNISNDVLVNAYGVSKSLRALSRQFGIGRGRIKRALLAKGVRILTNDQAIIHSNRKNFRQAFNGSLSEKAHLYGFVVGDVTVFKKSKYTLRAITHSTRKSFICLFHELFDTYGFVRERVTKQGDVSLCVDLDYVSFKFLETRLQEHLPGWISEDLFFPFLAGFTDADGTIMLRKAGAYFQYVVKFFGENVTLLREIKGFLERRGMHPGLYKNAFAGDVRHWRGKVIRYNHDYYVLEVYRKADTLRLLRILQVKHSEKSARKTLLLDTSLRDVCSWQDVREEVLRLRQEEEVRQLAPN